MLDLVSNYKPLERDILKKHVKSLSRNCRDNDIFTADTLCPGTNSIQGIKSTFL